jgi:putative OPT family oligopeptide transporter
MANNQSFISAATQLPEITLKVIVISIVLTIILATSNAYLALKVGMLTSASIPAAILSMSILRWFKNSNILENNLIQTAASAGEAVAGGVVYTVPALILIHYWTNFSYWENLTIAIIGGVLGVMFSIPIRQVLVHDKVLKFPEGQAIAEVLIAGSQTQFPLKPMLYGSVIGAIMELAQTGFKIFAANIQFWMSAGRTVVGFGSGLSATLIGVGYLVGFDIGISILIGAIIAWGILVPIVTALHPITTASSATATAMTVWGNNIRYVGIGAMLTAGIWTLGTLFKPFAASLRDAILGLRLSGRQHTADVLRTEMDLPLYWVCLGVLVCLMGLYFLFSSSFPLTTLPLHAPITTAILWSSIAYVLVFGFIFSAICGYFSGMVGVTASPGSAVIIASLFLAAIALRIVLGVYADHIIDSTINMKAAAIAILIGAIITGAACIANDNIQDLKVGHLVGATPWKQQIMLLFGVIIAAAVIPLIMQLLFNVYGIGDVLPRPGMNIADALPAPPAAMMAAVTSSVFLHQMPWNMVWLGIGIGIGFIILQCILQKRGIKLSVLAMATGIYFPLSTSTPIFIGSMLQRYVAKRVGKNTENKNGSLIACGLVTGAALMDVLLAIPFAIMKNPDQLMLLPTSLTWLTNLLGIIAVIALLRWFYLQASKN